MKSYIIATVLFCCLLVLSIPYCRSQSSDQITTQIFGTNERIPFGLTGNIYYLKRGTHKLPKNFEKLKIQGSIHTKELNISPRSFTQGFPGIGNRNEWFAIDYNGFFYMEEAQQLIFALLSDDGSKLIIDDRIIINHDGQHSPQIKYGKVKLEAGIHKMNVSYFQGPRTDLALSLSYKEKNSKAYVIFNFDDFSPVSIEKPDMLIMDDILDEDPELDSDTLIFTIEINNQVLFEINQYQLKPEAKIVLNEIYYAYIQDNPSKQMIIEGHTDNTGKDSYNMILSEQRAKSVANFFANNYGMSNRINTIAYGETKPKTDNLNTEQQAFNRRVEILIMDSCLINSYIITNKP